MATPDTLTEIIEQIDSHGITSEYQIDYIRERIQPPVSFKEELDDITNTSRLEEYFRHVVLCKLSEPVKTMLHLILDHDLPISPTWIDECTMECMRDYNEPQYFEMAAYLVTNCGAYTNKVCKLIEFSITERSSDDDTLVFLQNIKDYDIYKTLKFAIKDTATSFISHIISLPDCDQDKAHNIIINNGIDNMEIIEYLCDLPSFNNSPCNTAQNIANMACEHNQPNIFRRVTNQSDICMEEAVFYAVDSDDTDMIKNFITIYNYKVSDELVKYLFKNKLNRVIRYLIKR